MRGREGQTKVVNGAPKPDVDAEALHDIADRVLPGSGRATVERAASGMTTQIYRIRRNETTLFVRIAEDADDSMAMEGWVHGELRRRGARVPEVVLLEPWDERIGRSVMVTTEIPGRSIREGGDTEGLDGVMVEAGRDVALIGDVAVRGFGWIRRDPAATPLEAGLPSARALMLESLAERLTTLANGMLGTGEIERIERAVERYSGLLDADASRLAHGDLDETHVFRRGAAYTGIIDFGEIRGAPPMYDVAHYALHDQAFAHKTLPSLLEGYADAAALPSDHQVRIPLLALLIGVRVLTLVADRPLLAYRRSLQFGIHEMVEQLP
jgi:aminoglycoside phosphotransferase (APT) family kinase protein